MDCYVRDSGAHKALYQMHFHYGNTVGGRWLQRWHFRKFHFVVSHALKILQCPKIHFYCCNAAFVAKHRDDEQHSNLQLRTKSGAGCVCFQNWIIMFLSGRKLLNNCTSKHSILKWYKTVKRLKFLKGFKQLFFCPFAAFLALCPHFVLDARCSGFSQGFCHRGNWQN